MTRCWSRGVSTAKGSEWEFETREQAEAVAEHLKSGSVWIDGEDWTGRDVLETRIVDLEAVPDSLPPDWG
jgi:hypothetical protein